MNNEINTFYDKGFIIKKILTNEQCDKINEYIENNNKNAYYEKNTNIKFGYKFDSEEISPIKDCITENPIINEFCSKILSTFKCSIIRSYYKSAFIARDIEYHQEYAYKDLHPYTDNWQDYIQIFIALEDHSLENSCLKIIPESHKMGHLKYNDIVNSNLEHKKAVSYEDLRFAYNKYGIVNCELKKGEAIFFNYLIIHGSQNNNSPFSRHALVCSMYKSDLTIDNNIVTNFTKKRKEYTIHVLEDKIKQLKQDLTTL
jgi:ectoine hydroxylase-related dioxygenase (phytanoyl-CoA dioxygenase family)